ncbi:MAG TPA: CBS domain-containing protein [Phycisphaerae bacterium]|nr:CBS domain-containing protein [Phycisphaerae bacterium]HOB74274.1 CBS domain-containing protein [Phycisphaerae bacterium]HOJ53135.1 CBS domain-containing protein [Phycisphaerae bacterium]HOL24872.1 CBS domain-containing protein [Phycisphaerae bacterium]HPP19408.1 CBS domain-containing protein [Phycisphaerae bacterium]
MGLRENLCYDNVTQLPLEEPLIVAPETSVRRTVQVMRSVRAGYALICRGRRLVGIFTDRDLIKRILVRRVDPASPIEPYMTPEPVTIRCGDPIASAIRIMFQGHYRHLPVVSEDDVPVGIVSAKHIVAYLVDHYPSTVYNLPPRPGQVQSTREGA